MGIFLASVLHSPTVEAVFFCFFVVTLENQEVMVYVRGLPDDEMHHSRKYYNNLTSVTLKGDRGDYFSKHPRSRSYI